MNIYRAVELGIAWSIILIGSSVIIVSLLSAYSQRKEQKRIEEIVFGKGGHKE